MVAARDEHGSGSGIDASRGVRSGRPSEIDTIALAGARRSIVRRPSSTRATASGSFERVVGDSSDVADPAREVVHHADDAVDGEQGPEQELLGPAVGLDRRPERDQRPAPVGPGRREHDPDVPAPGVADPVHGLPDVERREHLAGSRGTVVQGVAMPGVGARAVARAR